MKPHITRLFGLYFCSLPGRMAKTGIGHPAQAYADWARTA